MNFDGFIEKVQLLSIGEEVKYWNFKVRYEHTRSIWIYYRGQEIAITHSKTEAVAILRAMYKTIKVEFDGGM